MYTNTQDKIQARRELVKQRLGVTEQQLETIRQGLAPELDSLFHFPTWYREIWLQQDQPEAITQWLDTYNSIKQPGWQECQNCQDLDQLSPDIKRICTEHGFDFDAEFEQVSTEVLYQRVFAEFPITQRPDSMVRYQQVLLDNADLIRGRDVVDFAVNLGIFAFGCLHNGAQSVVGTEIRTDMVEHLNKVCTQYGHPKNKIDIKQADIHDYQNNTMLCQGKDTVLLSGILYHIQDHYPVIKSICAASPQHIILETVDFTKGNETDTPCIYWRNEQTQIRLHAWNYGESAVPVGLPNTAWLDMVLNSFGYHRIRQSRNTTWGTIDLLPERQVSRMVYVYQKI
jgi:hypothetical protein